MTTTLPHYRLITPSIIALIALLAACTSGPKVFINQNPNANFTAYRTYNYLPTLGTDGGDRYRSVLSNYFINAMDQQMQARGYKKSENPDILINFNVQTQEKIRTTQSPNMNMGGYYGYRGGYYGAYGGYDTTVTQYTEGTVTIDLVDNSTDTLAWEGTAMGRITDKVRENAEQAVNVVTADVMAKYPYYAQGFVPPPAPADSK